VTEVGVAFSLEVATLSTWAREIVTTSEGKVSSRGVAVELLRRSIAKTVGAGVASAFAPISATQGLLARVMEATDELTSEAVEPTDFEAAAGGPWYRDAYRARKRLP